jgi:PEP-CTERM motif
LKYFTLLLVAAGSFAHGSSLFTTFAGGNDYDGNMFDVSVGANALMVTGLDVNVDTGSLTINVYTKAGTYVGSETNSAAWTLDSSTAVTGLGEGNETFVSITPFLLSANAVTGMYVTINTNVDAAPFMYYTDGNNTYSNADLTLTAGDGLGGLFGSLGVFAPRTWNGQIDYDVQTATPEPSSLWLLGAGLVAFAVRKKF